MKKIIVAGLIAVGALFVNKSTVAQVQVNINIGQQPLWGPVGYDYVQYYYIPELNVYYDVLNGMYIYPQRNKWIHAAMLPPHFGHFDIFRLHKVVINQMNPFRYNHQHLRKYGHYKGHYNQMAIRDSRDHRYYANPHHPRHREYQNYRRPNNATHNRAPQGGPRYNDRMANRPQQGRTNQNQRVERPDNRIQNRSQSSSRERMQSPQRAPQHNAQRAPQQRVERAPQQQVQKRQYVERKQANRGNQGRGQTNKQNNERGGSGRR